MHFLSLCSLISDYLGETVISFLFAISFWFLNSLQAVIGHIKLEVIILNAEGTSIIISFSEGFAVSLNVKR